MPKPPASGYIGQALVVSGRIAGTGDLTVHGNLHGEVALQGQLIVASGGSVQAPVRADVVAVAGSLHGPVAASRVLVRSGGHLVGDVRANTVGLEDGGRLDGTVEMDFEFPYDGEEDSEQFDEG